MRPWAPTDQRKLANLLRSLRSSRVPGAPAVERGVTRPSARLELPRAAEDRAALAARLGPTLRASGTRMYVDTSFLLWLCRIGQAPRAELLAWLHDACGARLAVPVWAAHEFYRHLTTDRGLEDMRKQLDDVESHARAAYQAVWPLLDEPVRGFASAGAQQAEVRSALRGLLEFVAVGKLCAARFRGNADDVTRFVNEHPLEHSEVLSLLSDIENAADARFTGRVPPGFQDRNKREKEDAEGSVGDNRWGDLVFWREILADAKRRRASTLVILTRDEKNDWRMGGSLPVADSGGPERATPAVPPHPFLSFEAARECGAKEVVLVSPSLLAAVAKADAPGRTAAYWSAVQVPPLAAPRSVSERRAESTEREVRQRSAAQAVTARAGGYLFTDPDDLALSPSSLARALLNSRELPSRDEIAALEAALAGGADLRQAFSPDVVRLLGGNGLVLFARRLADRAAASSHDAARLSDLMGLLPQLPLRTAGNIYFGLLAAMYLNADNSGRQAPVSPVAQPLLALQREPLAPQAIEALRRRFASLGKRPLYLPDALAPILPVQMRTDGDLADRGYLSAMRFEGRNLLIDVQADQVLRLAARVGGDRATPDRLLEEAANLYGLPLDQLRPDVDVDEAYLLTPTLGFRNASDVWTDPLEDR